MENHKKQEEGERKRFIVQHRFASADKLINLRPGAENVIGQKGKGLNIVKMWEIIKNKSDKNR